ncbi:citrate/2-methylcitrate synthase [Desulfogranum japonicum]|uniref:citrate/2-methylcitrate synthase n=1 Tax=Desulfogranum japonicum TaxID=231447 RepID=UPI00048EAD34|nr:citrate/2-methylcitrate synthase [Desulfogranum japonicum]
MAEEKRVKNTGLRGVAIADSAVSFIDGEKGVLIYRGYRIEDLADRSTFMETAYLLIYGYLPSSSELEDFDMRVRSQRSLPGHVIESMKKMPVEAHPMDVLQAAVPMLAMADADITDVSRERYYERSISLLAKFPTMAAAWHRIRNGLEPLQPDNDLEHAANFLYMLQGEKPDQETAKDLDTCLILHADHTFNASTFAAREVVSTQASIYAGVSAAIGALSGGLHGGANARVMSMLLELEHTEDVEGWVKDRLEQKKKIMGLGHAIYKTGDPRAVYLKRMGERLQKKTGQPWFAISQKIEETALAIFSAQGKNTILPNVDFNSAPVYYLMGIPIDFMTPVFAIARVSGWCSHIIEESFGDAQGKPALYRPKAEYVGNYCGLFGCTYMPMSDRKKE